MFGNVKISKIKNYMKKSKFKILLNEFRKNPTLENLKYFAISKIGKNTFKVFYEKYILPEFPEFKVLYYNNKEIPYEFNCYFLRGKLNICKCGNFTLYKWCSNKCSNNQQRNVTEETKRKRKETLLKNHKKYFVQTDEFKKQFKQNNLEKYGVSHFSQKHFKNFENLNRDFLLENFVKDSRFLINECCEYFNCKIHFMNKFKRLNNINIKNIIKTCKTQQFIFDNLNFENKIFNDRHLKFEIDIFLKDFKIGVEYNGILFHSSGKQNLKFGNISKSYHFKKYKECLRNNIILFNIFEYDNLDLYIDYINKFKNFYEIKDFKILEISKEISKDFFNKNHIKGYFESEKHFGLYKDNELISAINLNKNYISQYVYLKNDNTIDLLINFLKTKFNNLFFKADLTYYDYKIKSKIIKVLKPEKFLINYRTKEFVNFEDENTRIIYNCGYFLIKI